MSNFVLLDQPSFTSSAWFDLTIKCPSPITVIYNKTGKINTFKNKNYSYGSEKMLLEMSYEFKDRLKESLGQTLK